MSNVVPSGLSRNVWALNLGLAPQALIQGPVGAKSENKTLTSTRFHGSGAGYLDSANVSNATLAIPDTDTNADSRPYRISESPS